MNSVLTVRGAIFAGEASLLTFAPENAGTYERRTNDSFPSKITPDVIVGRVEFAPILNLPAGRIRAGTISPPLIARESA